MGISVVNPVGQAVERTKLVLFRDFRLGKWFVLGFCAFLATLFEGCSGGGGGNGGSGGGGPGHWPPRQELDWLKANLEFVITIAVAVLVTLILLGALITWLKCRGRFMFIDGIVHNRAAVVEPWKAFRALGNSLFWIAFGLDLLMLTIALGAVAAGIAIAWPDLESGQFTSRGSTGIVIGGGSLLGFAILYAVFRTLLMDFVVPTMYIRNEGVLRSCDIVYGELVLGQWQRVLFAELDQARDRRVVFHAQGA